AGSTRTTCPLTLSAVLALPCASHAGFACPSAAPVHDIVKSATPASTLSIARIAFLLFLVDVIDRPRDRPDASTDERALPRPVPGARTDCGASPRTHRGPGQRPATGDREQEHRHPDGRCNQSLPHDPLPLNRSRLGGRDPSVELHAPRSVCSEASSGGRRRKTSG